MSTLTKVTPRLQALSAAGVTVRPADPLRAPVRSDDATLVSPVA